MKDLITTVAEQYGIPEGNATAFLAELSKRAEAVGYASTNEDGDLTMLFFDRQEARMYCDGEEPIPIFTFPPIHDIEAIENRVAEACAKLADAQQEMRIKFLEGMGEDSRPFVPKDTAKAIRNREWRKHK